MIKQLYFDFSKLFFQKKYLFILISINFIGMLYVSFQINKKNLSAADIIQQLIYSFRPLFWLVCCYIICDIISSDYHYRVLKTVLLYAKSRRCYIISKFVTAITFCLIIFITVILSCNFVFWLLGSGHTWNMSNSLFTSLTLGAFSGIFVLASIFIFYMIITESDAVTIGLSIGTMFVMLVLESFDFIIKILPTMWILTFSFSVYKNSNLDLLKIALILLISSLLLFSTLQVFNKKDIR